MIGIFGGSQCSDEDYRLAWEVGNRIAERGGIIVCGGLFGVMEAVCKGASEANGMTIGVLPGEDIFEANPYVKIPIATGMGIGRNIIIARSARVCIAINGKYGTLSEIAFALQLGKPVIGLKSWVDIPGLTIVTNAEEAVKVAFSYL